MVTTGVFSDRVVRISIQMYVLTIHKFTLPFLNLLCKKINCSTSVDPWRCQIPDKYYCKKLV